MPIGPSVRRTPRLPSRHRDASGSVPRRARRIGADGQALVEFALILPILLVLIMAIIEFALAFNASLAINRASQEAALIASEAGNLAGADCMILQTIDQMVGQPNDRTRIAEVQIQRTAPAGGNIYASSVYHRTGTMTCALADGTNVTVPYTASSSGYPVSQRCNVLAGCPALTPVRTTVDTIGVQIRYQYDWKTPLSAAMTLIDGQGTRGTTWTFSKRNVFRMEPQL